ncbi:MAG: hypothetical protein AB8B48_19940 [Pseudomonadales bacterium]
MKLLPNALNKIFLIGFLLLSVPAYAMSWSIGPSMKTPRSEFQVAVLDNKLYVAGGIARFRTTRRCEVLDLSANRWELQRFLLVRYTYSVEKALLRASYTTAMFALIQHQKSG